VASWADRRIEGRREKTTGGAEDNDKEKGKDKEAKEDATLSEETQT